MQGEKVLKSGNYLDPRQKPTLPPCLGVIQPPDVEDSTETAQGRVVKLSGVSFKLMKGLMQQQRLFTVGKEEAILIFQAKSE